MRTLSLFTMVLAGLLSPRWTSKSMPRFLIRYLPESVGAAYLCTALAYVAQTAIGGAHGDHQWVKALIAPAFILPIGAGIFAAYVMRNHIWWTSYFAWVIPCILLLKALPEVFHNPYATHSEMWSTLLGTDCSSSECLYQAFYTVPFVCALSYSISSVVITVRSRNSR